MTKKLSEAFFGDKKFTAVTFITNRKLISISDNMAYSHIKTSESSSNHTRPKLSKLTPKTLQSHFSRFLLNSLRE